MSGTIALCIFHRDEYAVPPRAISVNDVRPLYGPLSGGTQVTISGQSVSMSSIAAVFFGLHKAYPNRLKLNSQAYVRSPV